MGRDKWRICAVYNVASSDGGRYATSPKVKSLEVKNKKELLRIRRPVSCSGGAHNLCTA